MKPREMLKGKFIDFTDLSDFRKKIGPLKKKVVFTAGNWDLLHVGQMRYLTEAKTYGDILVVGCQSNDAIRKVKGPNKPILDEWIRAETLAFLRCVDFITINPKPSSKPVLELLQPDTFITVGEDWAKDYKLSPEYRVVNAYGGKIIVVDRQSPFVSTSKVMERIIGGELSELLKKYDMKKLKPIKERAEK
jgi:rfaE bifunctional protein nucleotidyltransferase chain/domain